jgi:hypothetical protein
LRRNRTTDTANHPVPILDAEVHRILLDRALIEVYWSAISQFLAQLIRPEKLGEK